MNDKPLNIRVYESCGYNVRHWENAWWQVEVKPGYWSDCPPITDDGAALELLKAWRNLVKGSWYKIIGVDDESYLVELSIGYSEDCFSKASDSLAQAICLALVAAGEKGERT